MQRPGTSQGTERPLRPVRQALGREPLPPDKAARGLLLLHMRTPGGEVGPRALLRRDGTLHDQGHTGRPVHHQGRPQHENRHTQRLGPLRCSGTSQVAVRRVVLRRHPG